MSWTPSRRKIFTCMPQTPQDDQPCAKQIITTLAREAYRRPVTATDVDPLMAIYTAGAKDGGFETGVRDAITAILASPFFLYRAEPTPARVAPGKPIPSPICSLPPGLRSSCGAAIPTAN